MTLVAFGALAFACLVALRGLGRLLTLVCLLTAGATGAASAQLEGVIIRPTEQWNGWEDLGAQTIGRPECLATQVNRIDCFTRINGGLITRKQWTGQNWVGPTLLGGLQTHALVTSHPDCVTWEADHIDCFARQHDADVDGRSPIFRRVVHGGFMTGWEFMMGEVAGDPECLAMRVGRIECFARGANGQLMQNSFDGDMWGGWTARGGQILADSDIACVSFRGEPNCVIVTPQNTLQQMRFTATGVEARAMQNGVVTGSPKCYVLRGVDSADFDDQIVCLAPRLTSLARWIWTGTGNLSWGLSDMGGPLAGADWDCVTRGGERLDCIELVPTRNQQNTQRVGLVLRHRSLQPGQGVTQSGDVLALQNIAPIFIRCVSWAPERIDCFIAGNNAPLLHAFLAPVEQPPRLAPGGNRPPILRQPSN